ncbi:PAS-domain containing protein [Mesorhizobium sp. MSK_1335]|uniref:PAS-domain containing protein n=1 Tax=Mesorhizobium montanum TaxID=3072323 RepID=A0ABU4ZKL2_9HYPH|nr:PAS-domain containing protein [Mesorhizobium sp. MSK_1335]MDX8525933.1 PAS-domain containing protein [Mesorhizobium sp. MSK_1335]
MVAESSIATVETAGQTHLAALSQLAVASYETLERELRAAIAVLEAQARRFEMAIDNIPQGICFFDVDERLILCNRRYAQIYGIAPDKLQAGITLADVVEHLLAAGTSAMDGPAYLAFARSISSSTGSRTWIAELKDGRIIQVGRQPIPGGGWVSTHEDVTELAASRVMVSERVSLQALIDWVPDYLWVKDTESRFVVVNKALAADHGKRDASEMIGLNDFDLHAPELARQFRASEQDLLRSGQPMVDKEEFIVDASGTGKWLSSTKVPPAKRRGRNLRPGWHRPRHHGAQASGRPAGWTGAYPGDDRDKRPAS